MSSAKQTIDLQISRDTLEGYLRATGYWGCDETRSRNAYILSPSGYVISPRQRARLEALAKATYGAVKNLGSTLAGLAKRKGSLKPDEARFLKLAESARKGLLDPGDVECAIPPALKVDLVQDDDGRYFIAEVDAYNPRGYGYLALLDETVPSGAFRRSGPGIAGFAALLRSRQLVPDSEWMVIVSEFERFYEPTFRILVHALACHGVRARLVRELSLSDAYLDASEHDPLHVLLVPETMDRNVRARDRLLKLYKAGAVRSFFPPAAYLGSKAFLPFLAGQEGMRAPAFIPPASLVGRTENPWSRIDPREPFVLKGVMSSGLKKVIFSDAEPKRVLDALIDASSRREPGWIVQKQIRQHPVPIVVFDDRGHRVTKEYYLRLTAYIAHDAVLGLEVTGRESRDVHGAKDCIQIPAVSG